METETRKCGWFDWIGHMLAAQVKAQRAYRAPQANTYRAPIARDSFGAAPRAFAENARQAAQPAAPPRASRMVDPQAPRADRPIFTPVPADNVIEVRRGPAERFEIAIRLIGLVACGL